MSIVIAVIDHTLQNLYLYGDNRRTTTDINGTEITRDDFTKIGKIKKNLFIGGTGNAGVVDSFLNLIVSNKHLSNDELIDLMSRTPFTTYSEHSSLIMCGEDNSGRLFISSKNTQGVYDIQFGVKQGSIIPAIACTGQGSYEIAMEALIKELSSSNFTKYGSAIHVAIQSVSAIDPSVSPTVDYIHFSLND